MLNDRPNHPAQRRITCSRRLAIADLFLGQNPASIAALISKGTVGQLGYS
jgi:hypothetical protein